VSRPREFLDQRRFQTIRRGICDAELASFHPRRLDPPPPRGLTSGNHGALAALVEPVEQAAGRIVDGEPLADLLDAIKAPDRTDVRRRGGRWAVQYTRLQH
jgi:hypothetical protein